VEYCPANANFVSPLVPSSILQELPEGQQPAMQIQMARNGVSLVGNWMYFNGDLLGNPG